MKLTDVPQDNDLSYEGQTKLCYAVDEKGQFVTANTNGWHVEETVKSLAWKMIEKDLQQTKELVRQGKASPLLYFMKRRQMDPALLAQNMGFWTVTVKWHLRPQVFKKMKPELLQKYSECLEISVDELKNFTGEG